MMRYQLKNAVYQYGNTLNEMRNQQKSSDPLVQQKMNNMNNDLNNLDQTIQNQRPAMQSNAAPEMNAQELDMQYKNALLQYLRNGSLNDLTSVSNEMQNTLQNPQNIADSNGYSVSKDMMQIIFERVNASPIRKFARQVTVSKDLLDIAAYVNEIQASWGDDKSVAPETDAFIIKSIRLSELTAQPKITQKMVDDSEIDIESWLAELLSDIFLVKEEEAFLYGDGLNKPKGILSYADGTDYNSISRTINSSATEIKLESLLNLYGSLDNKYEREGEVAFITSKQVISQIRTMKDSLGQYIWTPGVLTNKQDTLFGMPIYATPAFKNIASKSDVMIYGNLRKGYHIADRMDIKIQRDPFSSKPFIIYFATKKVGADVIDCNAIKALKMS